jgi:hypothetical protein
VTVNLTTKKEENARVMFFLSKRLFGWVQWFSRRELLPRDRTSFRVLYCPRVREGTATRTVPGSGTD